MKQEYKWDAETGIAQHICTLSNGTVIVGEAICHEDDKDLMNKNTGFAIAEMRSYIKSLQNYKNNILRPELNSLKQLYYSINRSKNFNENSYEARALKRHIKMKEFDIEVVKEEIDKTRSYLKEFINSKDRFYKMVRAYRKKHS